MKSFHQFCESRLPTELPAVGDTVHINNLGRVDTYILVMQNNTLHAIDVKTNKAKIMGIGMLADWIKRGRLKKIADKVWEANPWEGAMQGNTPIQDLN